MTKKSAILMALFLGLVFCVNAQNNKKDRKAKKSAITKTKTTSNALTPKNMWEVGVNPGYAFVSGDVTSEPGYGIGLHVRKATDFVFSLRLDGNYSMVKGKSTFSNASRQFETTWISGTGFGVISLNSLRWDKPVRPYNVYAMIGAGGNFYDTEFRNISSADSLGSIRDYGTLDREFAPHVAAGAGVAIRISKRINVGVEHQAFMVMGSRADQLDGTQGTKGNTTPFRDIFHFTSLSINVNIGKSGANSEPLYWINPLDKVLKDVADVKARSGDFTTDSDEDGVIDALDQEPDTPREATVDTKGRTLDSDRDGVADYKDKEPYYTPRPGETVNSLGVVENPINAGGVTENRVKELIDEALQDFRNDPSYAGPGGSIGGGGGSMTEWFLPMIHFGTDSYTIKYSDYGTLASIARMMKGNTSLKLVVTGFTDQTAPENYNNKLSYSRAQSVVDHLVNNHGIGRGRLVLQWKGEGETLVPFASSYMNRRVEFRVAQPDDVEMDPPSSSGSDGY